MKKINLIRQNILAAVTMLLAICAGCEYLDSGIEDSTFYDYEIFSGDELDFYGKWKFVDYYGGFTGAHKEPTYDYLKMKSSGVYEIYKGLKCIEKGKIVGEIRYFTPDYGMMRYQFLYDGIEASGLVTPGFPAQTDTLTGLKRETHEITFDKQTKLVDGKEVTIVDHNVLYIVDCCVHVFKRVK